MENHNFNELKKWLARGGVQTIQDIRPIQYQLATRSRKEFD